MLEPLKMPAKYVKINSLTKLFKVLQIILSRKYENLPFPSEKTVFIFVKNKDRDLLFITFCATLKDVYVKIKQNFLAL